jgi:type VI protein secretion system component Hcp
MNKRFVVCLAVALLTWQAALAHAVIYIQIPNIQGEVTEPAHLGWTEAQSLSWSHTEAPPGSPVKVQFNRVICTKFMDSVSAALALSAADGHLMKDVKVEIVRSNGSGGVVVTSRMKLTNVRLTAYAVSAQSGPQLPMESLSLAFDTMTWINFKLTPQGQAVPGTAACWDVANNKSCTPIF